MATNDWVSDWLTVKAAATLLGIGPKPLYRAITTGELRAARLSRRGDIRIRRDWLMQWVEQRAPCPQRRPDGN